MLAVFSRKTAEIPHLHEMFECDGVIVNPKDYQSDEITLVAGWGLKPSSEKALAYAREYDLPYVTIEEGFLRSGLTPDSGQHTQSLIVDYVGAYYDSSCASQIENDLNTYDVPHKDLDLAKQAIRLIVDWQISKYNCFPAFHGHTNCGHKNILIVDQIDGDLSLIHGNPQGFTLEEMIEDAMVENPDAHIIIKPHPASIGSKKKGLVKGLAAKKNITILNKHYNPISLLGHVDEVYTLTSQLGLEALFLGKEVTCYGAPFYSGWGLTKDKTIVSRRKAKRTIEELFACAYIKNTRYRPVSDGDPRHPLIATLDRLKAAKDISEIARGDKTMVGFSPWKRPIMESFLKTSPKSSIKYCKNAKKSVDSELKVLCWGSKAPQLQDCIRVEDGFIRSASLGSDLTKPWSLCFDDQGIYFEPSQPSRLEQILSDSYLDKNQTARIDSIIKRIIDGRITKYNTTNKSEIIVPTDKKIIFCPGQVPDDASLTHVELGDDANIGLLKKVRENNPDAFIVFKPHPDTLSRNRAGSCMETCKQIADLVCEDGDLASFLDVADEVHTATSTVGFEALLRGIKVTTWGAPFYAGYGLTTDMSKHPAILRRKNKNITIQDLAYAALISYPTYYDWEKEEITDCETVLNALSRLSGTYVKPSALRRLFSRVARSVSLWLH